MLSRSIASVAVMLLLGNALAADDLKSGPQVGDRVPARFTRSGSTGTTPTIRPVRFECGATAWSL